MKKSRNLQRMWQISEARSSENDLILLSYMTFDHFFLLEVIAQDTIYIPSKKFYHALMVSGLEFDFKNEITMDGTHCRL